MSHGVDHDPLNISDASHAHGLPHFSFLAARKPKQCVVIRLFDCLPRSYYMYVVATPGSKALCLHQSVEKNCDAISKSRKETRNVGAFLRSETMMVYECERGRDIIVSL